MIRASVCGLLAVGMLVALAGQCTGSDAVCDRYASPNGGDLRAGTHSSPYRTAQRLVDSLRPGETGCLRTGTYLDEQILFGHGGNSARRITLRAYPGEDVTLRGQVKLPDGTDHVTVKDLTLDGTYGPVRSLRIGVDEVSKRPVYKWSTPGSPFVHGDDITFENVEVYKANDVLRQDLVEPGEEAPERASGVCFLIGGYQPQATIIADRVTLDRVYVHHCGYGPVARLIDPNPGDHGIYSAASTNLTITDTVTAFNGSRGLQLRASSLGPTEVDGLISHGNRDGVVFSDKARDVTIVGSVFSRNWNRNINVTATEQQENIVVKDSCLDAEARATAPYLTYENVVNAPPRYAPFPKITNPRCAQVYTGEQGR